MSKIRCSHILVEKHPKAQEILSELNNGVDFSELARRYSVCPSKKKGGDLGFFAKGQMVKEFERVAFKLKNDEISDIVKTQFGYHIIKRTD